MNRKQRKARKMFLRKYGRSTNPWWRRQIIYDEQAEITPAQWKELFESCQKPPKP